MSNHYQSLSHHLLAPGTTIFEAPAVVPGSIRLRDPAETVFTDFRKITPFSIMASAALDDVDEKMIASGVRLLFVTDNEASLLGLITYTDLYGEKPVRYIREQGGSRNEIIARDLMTPLDHLESLHQDEVNHCKVGDIIETIKSIGRQHMLVNETADDGSQVITGMFSSTHIERLVGMKIELSARASTFADLERALT